jgi:shikimate kinase
MQSMPPCFRGYVFTQNFYLHVSFAEIEKRLKNIATRGIVIKKGNNLKDVYEERFPLYIKYAYKKVDCTSKTIEDCVNEIIKQVKQ